MSTVKTQNFTCWTTRRVLDYSSKATMTQIVRAQGKELEIQNMQKLLNIQASKKLLKSWHVWSNQQGRHHHVYC
jgi:predicted NAD/FAD-dependent oxidoreductase